jgi:hypothetical protein
MDQAQEIINWSRDYFKTATNNFEFNMLAAASRASVNRKTIGFVSYLPEAYKRFQEQEIEKQRLSSGKTSEWVGEVKERLVFTGYKLVFSKWVETMYGGTCIQKFVNKDGVMLVWFGSAQLDVDEDTELTFKATVKEHSFYKDEKQTIVNRLKLIEETDS